MAMQGIDTILQHLANASGALERTARPGIKEVKEAAGSAKIAADLLKASETFLSNGIYVICDEPAGAYVDPAEHRIEMLELTGVEPDLPAELLPLPDLLGDFAQLHETAQAAAFEDHLQTLWGKTEHGTEDDDPASEWSNPWRAAFTESRLDAFARLTFALDHRLPITTAFPTDEEMATWRAGFAAPPAPMPDLLLDGFMAANDVERKVAFESALEDLDGRGLEVNPDDSSDWPDAPWWAVYDLNPARAWNLLQFAIHHREPFAFAVPTDEEFAAWQAQFAPVPELPAVLGSDALEVFQALLDKLEEAGVKEAGVKESCLKRKNWKKAERAWRNALALDTPGTIALLEGALTKSVITWEVPAAAPIPEEAF
jgi:hypothetical protein